MIDWLEIRQFAIAEHVEVEFARGFTTVTGETGSGKSIVVDAINILLGHRSEQSYIRHNYDTAELQASFALPDGHPALQWLAAQSMANERECILRRVLRRNKSSKGYINGHAVTAAQLKELGQQLVDIHGQNEHHSLLARAAQLALVDHAAENGEHVARLGGCYTAITQLQNQIAILNDETQSRQQRAALLQFQLTELTELAPLADEWPDLENRHKKMTHQQELVENTETIATALHESENSMSLRLIKFSDELEQLAEYASELTPIAALLSEARVNIEEAASQLQPLYRDHELDPETAAQLDTRYAAYRTLARKHQLQPQQLATLMTAMQQELDGIADPVAGRKRLEAELAAQTDTYHEVAEQMSARRATAATRLSSQVTAMMQQLGMAGGVFEIALHSRTTAAVTRYGRETTEFMVTANPGQPLQPLAKVASGGELARIALAIQVVLAHKTPVPTLIFDEVDVGIGGEVANVVGEKLRQLGETCQVICVTHLAQVAARGNHQFSVSKSGDQQVETAMRPLEPRQRVEEIARMVGGDRLTESSLAHAEAMLRCP